MKARMLENLNEISKFNNEYQIKYLGDSDFSEENLHNALIWLTDHRAKTGHIPDKIKQDIRKRIADYLLLLDGYDIKRKRHGSEAEAA